MIDQELGLLCPTKGGHASPPCEDVIETLRVLFALYGPPTHIRSDNGPERIAEALRSWLARRGTGTLNIEPGSPWENAYTESLLRRLADGKKGQTVETVYYPGLS